MRPLTLLLAGCLGGGTPHPIDDVVDTADTDPDTDPDTDSDTAAGTDHDGDGWTVEQGDCDDDDIWVNPAWDERPNDDKDNDCDGRIDEVFAGVVALQVQDQGTESTRAAAIDALGDLDTTWTLPGPVAARWMDERRGADGWVALDPYDPSLWTISTTGVATRVWHAADDTRLEDPPAFLYGVAWHPDGYALTTSSPMAGFGSDRLWRIDLDGTSTELASWHWFEESGAHDISAISLAVDPHTGEVLLFGVLGGVASWTPTTGLVVLVPEDPDADPTAQLIDAHVSDQGDVFGLGWATDGSGTPTGIWRFNRTTHQLALRGRWVNSDLSTPIDFTPVAFGIVSGTDFYVTANGGWYRTVWRVIGGTDSYATELWTNVLSTPPDPADAHRQLWGTAIRWTED